MTLFCEDEFDYMIVTQGINEIIPTMTLGSATNLPEQATRGAYILHSRVALTTNEANILDIRELEPGAPWSESGLNSRSCPQGMKDVNVQQYCDCYNSKAS